MDLEKLKNSTEIGKEIKDIEAFYETLDKELSAFDKKVGIECICNDGNCCEHFVPSLTALEAQYMAYAIIKSGKEEDVLERLGKYDEKSGVCPLYNKEGAFHCSLYMGRGLICRLFGQACFTNKEGHGIFHPCKWNINRKKLEQDDLKGMNVPIMGEYGRALCSIDSNGMDSEAIDIAILKALEKLKLTMELLDEET